MDDDVDGSGKYSPEHVQCHINISAHMRCDTQLAAGNLNRLSGSRGVLDCSTATVWDRTWAMGGANDLIRLLSDMWI